MNANFADCVIRRIRKARPEYWLILALLFALALKASFFIGLGRRDDLAYVMKAFDITRGLAPLPSSDIDVASTRLMAYYPMALFVWVFGVNEVSISAYFILCSLGSIVVVYFIGKRLFSPKVGLVAAFLLAFLPHEVIYSTQQIPDIAVAFYLGLTMLLLLMAEEKKSWRIYLAAGAVFGIAYMTKESFATFAIFIAAFLALEFLVERKVRLDNRLSFYLKGIAIFAVGFLAVASIDLLYYYSHGMNPLTNFITNRNNVMLEKNGNPNLDHYYYQMFNLYQDPSGHRVFGLFYFFVAAAIPLLLLKDFKKSFIIVVWLVVVFATFNYISSIVAGRTLIEREDKYLAVMSIPASLIVARAITLWKRPEANALTLFLIYVLLISAFPALNNMYAYNRNVVGDLRDSYAVMLRLRMKDVYAPDFAVGYLDFFNGFGTRNTGISIIGYQDDVVWEKIRNAFVLVNPVPDMHVQNKTLPTEWTLVATLPTNPSFGYTPRIYYAPA